MMSIFFQPFKQSGILRNRKKMCEDLFWEIYNFPRNLTESQKVGVTP